MFKEALNVVTQISTPLMLGGFVCVLFLYVIWMLVRKVPNFSQSHGFKVAIFTIKCFFWLALVAIVLGCVGYVLSKKSEITGKAINSQLNGIRSSESNLQSDVQIVKNALATNSSLSTAARRALIDGSEKDAVKQAEEIKTELAGTSDTDLVMLRHEWRAQESLWEIDQQKAQLGREEANRKDQEEKAKQEHVKELYYGRENSDCAPTFDYTVTRLYKMLSDIKNETGNPLTHDFASTPTVLSPAGFRDSTNFIALGTNAGWWRFIIHVYWNPYPRVFIQSQSNSMTIITVGPMDVDTNGIVSNMSISAFVGTSNGDKTPVIGKYPLQDCNKEIDLGLRSMIEAEDARFPLTNILGVMAGK